MIASDRFEVDEKNLNRSSDSDDRSLLFRTSNDLMTSILSYLGIGSICHIDIAVTNTRERTIWLAILSAHYLATLQGISKMASEKGDKTRNTEDQR